MGKKTLAKTPPAKKPATEQTNDTKTKDGQKNEDLTPPVPTCCILVSATKTNNASQTVLHINGAKVNGTALGTALGRVQSRHQTKTFLQAFHVIGTVDGVKGAVIQAANNNWRDHANPMATALAAHYTGNDEALAAQLADLQLTEPGEPRQHDRTFICSNDLQVRALAKAIFAELTLRLVPPS